MRANRQYKLIALLGIWLVVVFILPSSTSFLGWYYASLFPMLQTARMWVVGCIGVSVGDIIYIVCGSLLIVRLVIGVSNLVQKKWDWRSAMRFIVVMVAIVTIWFQVGWGWNYNRTQVVALARGKTESTGREISRAMDSASSRMMTDETIANIITYLSGYKTNTIFQLNNRSRQYIKQFTSCNVSEVGLKVKPTIAPFYIHLMGVDGYYNPFTGEGQILGDLPAFMLPFVLAHEMAHQAGVAAEGDANLLAYSISMMSGDSTFIYSASVNLWLYARRRLYHYDSAYAKSTSKLLPPNTRRQLDTLEKMYDKYEGMLSRYSAGIYDSYLKLQHQTNGIKSYSNVVYEAWVIDSIRGKNSQFRLPIY